MASIVSKKALSRVVLSILCCFLLVILYILVHMMAIIPISLLHSVSV